MLDLWEQRWLFKIADLGNIKKIRMYSHLFKTWYVLWGDENDKLVVPATVLRKLMSFNTYNSITMLEVRDEFKPLYDQHIEELINQSNQGE